MIIRQVVLVILTLSITSCTQTLQDEAGKMKAKVDDSASQTINKVQETVNTVEKKVQQGKDVIDSIQETSQKIQEFSE